MRQRGLSAIGSVSLEPRAGRWKSFLTVGITALLSVMPAIGPSAGLIAPAHPMLPRSSSASELLDRVHRNRQIFVKARAQLELSGAEYDYFLKRIEYARLTSISRHLDRLAQPMNARTGRIGVLCDVVMPSAESGFAVVEPSGITVVVLAAGGNLALIGRKCMSREKTRSSHTDRRKALADDPNGMSSIPSTHSAVTPTAPPTNFGEPPPGEIPILFNDRHVYAKPDRLKENRVLAALVRGNTSSSRCARCSSRWARRFRTIRNPRRSTSRNPAPTSK